MGRARVSESAQITHELTVTLDPRAASTTRALSGVVVDSSGHGVAGAQVVVAYAEEQGEESPEPQRTARAGRDGHFVIEDLPIQRVLLLASAEGFVSAQLSVQAQDAAPVRIVLRDACPVDLVLQGTENVAESRLSVGPSAPVVGAVHVTSAQIAVREHKGLAPDTLYERTLVLNGRGRATFAGVGPGSYLIEVYAEGFSPAQKALPFLIPEGCGDIVISGELGRGFTLRGEVLEEETNIPLAWALIDMDGTDPGAGRRTDEQGRFEYRGVAPGLHSFGVSADEHNSRLIGPLAFNGAFPERSERVTLSRVKPGEQPTTEFVGIGIALSAHEDEIEITSVLAGGGGANAGLKAGERMIAVDGVALAALGFDGTMQHIRGPIGTTVRLTLLRGGTKVDVIVEHEQAL